MNSSQSRGYKRLEALLAAGECVLLDGGVGSEVARRTGSTPGDPWALYDHATEVLEVHRQYAAADCDVITTHTWGLLGSTATARGRRPGRTGLPAWTVATRDAVDVARRGIAAAERTGQCAVAFSLNDADPLLLGERSVLELLWSVKRPDLVLIETLEDTPSPDLLGAIAEVTASDMPVWVSFRRVGRWPDEASGELTSALSRLAGVGVRAVLINCVPVDRATEALAELVASTTLPVGCYPSLGGGVDPARYGEVSAEWLARGARIIGGCCGVGPAHIAAVREKLARGIARVGERGPRAD